MAEERASGGGADEHTFDKDYWERHWADSGGGGESNPYLVEGTRHLTPGTALDAGCGEGGEAIWLAAHGWRVTGADISGRALAVAETRAKAAGVADRATWIEVDLTSWDPSGTWDLVITNYAHPAMPHLDFYRRIARWVAPGGTLLIVGHRHDGGGHGDGHDGHGHHGHEDLHDSTPPVEATVSVSDIVAVLDPEQWQIDTAAAHTRTMPTARGDVTLQDVVVRAERTG